MTYRERLWPSPWLLVVCLLLIPAGILVFAPIQLELGIGIGVALYVASAAILLGSAPTIAVDRTELRAGRARLPLEHVGEVTPLTGHAAVAARGVELDARAFTLFRAWLPGFVRVDNTDADDPVPYWLISTKRPRAFAAAIEAAKAD